jgi:TolB-like protein
VIILSRAGKTNTASDCHFGANARTASRRLNLAAAGRPRLSIVVLPFTNLSNYPGQQYFADGITEQSGGNRVRVGAHT